MGTTNEFTNLDKIFKLMKFLNFSKVFCLSPHPDDIELGMLGTIMKFTDTHFDVLCISSGNSNDSTSHNIDRKEEVTNLWADANLPNVKIHFAENPFFEELNESQWIGYVENEFIKKNDYDCIFIPTFDDSMFEHRYVNGWGPAFCRFSPISLVEYNLPSTLNHWQPNLFIDIDDQYERKVELLQHFTSQIHRSYFQRPMLDAFHSNFQCSKKGLHIVERFKLIEVILKS